MVLGTAFSVSVTTTARRGLYSGLGKALGVTDGVAREPSAEMVNQMDPAALGGGYARPAL